MNYNLHSEDDDLQEIAPILSSLPKKPINAPEGYFDQFPESIMQIIIKEKKSNNWLSIAATIAILLASGISLHLLDNKKVNSDVALIEQTSLSDQYLHEIDEEVLVEYASSIETKDESSTFTDEILNEDFTEVELLEQYN